MAEREERRRRAMAEEADKENRERQELWRVPISQGGLRFEAAPVLTRDPYPVTYVPQRKLTEPESPHLLIDRRMKQRNR
jgi:hypothetical protein